MPWPPIAELIGHGPGCTLADSLRVFEVAVADARPLVAVMRQLASLSADLRSARRVAEHLDHQVGQLRVIVGDADALSVHSVDPLGPQGGRDHTFAESEAFENLEACATSRIERDHAQRGALHIGNDFIHCARDDHIGVSRRLRTQFGGRLAAHHPEAGAGDPPFDARPYLAQKMHDAVVVGRPVHRPHEDQGVGLDRLRRLLVHFRQLLGIDPVGHQVDVLLAGVLTNPLAVLLGASDHTVHVLAGTLLHGGHKSLLPAEHGSHGPAVVVDVALPQLGLDVVCVQNLGHAASGFEVLGHL